MPEKIWVYTLEAAVTESKRCLADPSVLWSPAELRALLRALLPSAEASVRARQVANIKPK